MDRELVIIVVDVVAIMAIITWAIYYFLGENAPFLLPILVMVIPIPILLVFLMKVQYDAVEDTMLLSILLEELRSRDEKRYKAFVDRAMERYGVKVVIKPKKRALRGSA